MADAQYMGDEELAISFRQAKDKRAQIGVLADLNLCSPFAVAERLENLGELKGTGLTPEQFNKTFTPLDGSLRSSKGKRRKKTWPFDEQAARALYEAGKTDDEMRLALGTTSYQIKSWRFANGFSRPMGTLSHKKFKAKENAAVKKKNETQQAEAAAVEYTIEPEVQPGEEVVSVDGVAPMQVSRYLATLTELLTPAALKGALRINGSAVTEIVGIEIGNSDAGLWVDIKTEVA